MESCLCHLFSNNLCVQLEFERARFKGLLVMSLSSLRRNLFVQHLHFSYSQRKSGFEWIFILVSIFFSDSLFVQQSAPSATVWYRVFWEIFSSCLYHLLKENFFCSAKFWKRAYLGIFQKIPDCFGSFRNSSVCFGCFDINSKHRNKPKIFFFGFTKQTETNAKQILFRFVSVRTENIFFSFRGHPTLRALLFDIFLLTAKKKYTG